MPSAVILDYKFFCLITLSILCHSLLFCKASCEKSAESLMGFPLHVTICLSHSVFKYLFLPSSSFFFFYFNYSVDWCGPLWVNFIWNSLYSLNLDICFFFQFRKVFSCYFFKQVLCPFFSLFFSWDPGSISVSTLDIVSDRLN